MLGTAEFSLQNRGARGGGLQPVGELAHALFEQAFLLPGFVAGGFSGRFYLLTQIPPKKDLLAASSESTAASR